jgi:hypothetical protein
MREIFKSGSVRGLIVTLGLLPQQKVRYGLYSTFTRIRAYPRHPRNPRSIVVYLLLSAFIRGQNSFH